MSRIAAMVVAAVAFLFVGCVPSVTWLPDSSGFVFSSGEDAESLVHYDLKTKKQTVVTKLGDFKSFVPAVSPDGKSIAVAKVMNVLNAPNTVQLAIYNLDGKQTKLSEEIKFAKAKDANSEEKPKPWINVVYWSPDSKKILVCFLDPEQMQIGVYDVATNKCTAIGGVGPVWQINPILPDSSGFIATVKNKTSEKMILTVVDWAGKSTKFDPPLEVVEGPFTLDVQWVPDGFVWQSETHRTTFDLAKAKTTTKAQPFEVRLSKGDKLDTFARFGDGKTQACKIQRQKTPFNGEFETRLELQIGKEKPPVVVGIVGKDSTQIPVTSPDGKLVAVGLGPDILVINAKGEVVAKTPRNGE